MDSIFLHNFIQRLTSYLSWPSFCTIVWFNDIRIKSALERRLFFLSLCLDVPSSKLLLLASLLLIAYPNFASIMNNGTSWIRCPIYYHSSIRHQIWHALNKYLGKLPFTISSREYMTNFLNLIIYVFLFM